MEKDFYTDDFEQLLKDTTEDFRMYPSRKVWHSIYNDLHPAKKWPSFAVCLLLITAILYIGINNNNTINADAENLMLTTLAAGEIKQKEPQLNTSIKTNKQKPENPVAKYEAAPGNINTIQTPAHINPNGFNLVITYPVPVAAVTTNQKLPTDTRQAFAAGEKELKSEFFINVTIPIAEPAYDTTKREDLTQFPGEEKLIATIDPTTEKIIEPSGAEKTVLPDNANEIDPKAAPPEETGSTLNSKTKTDDKIWMEDFAFHNKKNGNKWKTRISTLVYVTPSIGYRILNRNNNFEPVNALLIRSSATSVDADDAISQQAALNLESGATGILDLSRRLRVKAGIQFNYTNYVSFADRLSHPTQTNVLLNDLETGNTMLFPFSTSYGNQGTDNNIRLNNKTAQFSVPIGADYKLAGNDKIKWYIGANIQPTYVAGGTAYLVSSDYKHYVEVPSMLRTWNLNAGFESILSYKTKGGSVINIGPQFRYQLFSTYSNRYTYTENLYSIGIKFGITRKF